jgi:ABC-2 type transport system permease protein
MKPVLSIARRELGAIFATPVGWACLSSLLLMTGLFFAWMLGLYAETALQAATSPWDDPVNLNDHLIAPFFGSWAVILLFLCPAISMGLIAQDRKEGSLELLLTAPVSTTQIVLGKYLGALGFVKVMLLCTLHFPVLLWWLGEPDPGVLLSCYLSILLLSSAFLAVGLAASSMTQSQLVALSISFAILLGFWVLGATDAQASGWLATLVEHASLLDHMERLTRGALHTRDLAYFAGFTAFFLFVAHQRIEAMRWAE